MYVRARLPVSRIRTRRATWRGSKSETRIKSCMGGRRCVRCCFVVVLWLRVLWLPRAGRGSRRAACLAPPPNARGPCRLWCVWGWEATVGWCENSNRPPQIQAFGHTLGRSLPLLRLLTTTAAGGAALLLRAAGVPALLRSGSTSEVRSNHHSVDISRNQSVFLPGGRAGRTWPPQAPPRRPPAPPLRSCCERGER